MASSEIAERLGPAMNDEVSRERENGKRLADAKTSSAHCSASEPRPCPRKKLKGPPTSSGLAGLLCTAWSGFIALGNCFVASPAIGRPAEEIKIALARTRRVDRSDDPSILPQAGEA